MSFLIKLVYPALATLTIGGGAYVGATSSSSNGIPSSNVSLALESKAEVLNQGRTSQEPSQPQLNAAIEEAHPQVKAKETEAPTHLSTAEINSEAHSHIAISETGVPEETQVTIGATDPNPESKEDHLLPSLKVPTGNCEIIDTPEGVKKQLPENIVYVAFSCKSNVYKTQLVDWKGYFPSDLLVQNSESFKKGDRVNIEVTDIDTLDDDLEQQPLDEEDDSQPEPLWTLFESDQFKTHNLTGNWGSAAAKDDLDYEEEDESEDEEKEVYKVKLPESINPDRFYLQWMDSDS